MNQLSASARDIDIWYGREVRQQKYIHSSTYECGKRAAISLNTQILKCCPWYQETLRHPLYVRISMTLLIDLNRFT